MSYAELYKAVHAAAEAIHQEAKKTFYFGSPMIHIDAGNALFICDRGDVSDYPKDAPLEDKVAFIMNLAKVNAQERTKADLAALQVK